MTPQINSPAQSAVLHGSVFGGQQPVSGASIQLYKVGTSGYGSAGVSILNPPGTPLTTGPGGGFSIGTDFTCPAPDTQVYLVATGGNPGLGMGMSNPALALMSALGPCGNLGSSTFIFVNELTTVASVYALAEFMGPGTATNGGTMLGSTGSNTAGLANAMATVNTLVNLGTGKAPGASVPAGTVVPVNELNTLADIIATCVNTDGTGTECGDLFADTKIGSFTPSNTIDAVLSIVLNPANHATDLYGLLGGSPPFQPTLGAAPNEWTVGVSYPTLPGANPQGVAIDLMSNIWVVDHSLSAASEFSNQGVDTFDTLQGGLSGPQSIAIDSSGNLWLTNPSANSISKLDSAGAASGSTPFTGGGLSSPQGIAIDGSNNVWVGNAAATVLSSFDNSGNDRSTGSGFPSGGSSPEAVAVDSSNNVWAPNFNSSSLAALDSGGAPLTNSPFTTGGLDLPSAVAIDGSGNVWVADDSSPSMLSEFDSTGSPLSVSGFPGGGLDGPVAIAVDGLGRPWIVNATNNSLSEFKTDGTAISPSAGYLASGSLSAPQALAIDSSGNLWISNYNGNTLTEVVGAAAPVVTPLSSATLGVEP